MMHFLQANLLGWLRLLAADLTLSLIWQFSLPEGATNFAF